MRKIIKPCGFHCIKVNGLGVQFVDQKVLEDVNLHIHCGTLNAIIGKNGAGKSTLIRAMLGDVSHSGTIEFKDIQDGKMQKLKIGYVPQSINIEKNTPISVYDLIASYQYRYPVFLPKSKKNYEKIEKSDNTVYFRKWSFLQQERGIAFNTNEENSLSVEYLIKSEPLSEPGWYFYEADYEEYRNQKG